MNVKGYNAGSTKAVIMDKKMVMRSLQKPFFYQKYIWHFSKPFFAPNLSGLKNFWPFTILSAMISLLAALKVDKELLFVSRGKYAG